ncbi:hypothetical protein D3C85_1257620 [compost metagenome]
MSARGSAAKSFSAPSAVPRSAVKPRSCASGTLWRMLASACSTLDVSRPITTTVAPDSASALLMPRPMPAVLPLTIASFPLKSIFMFRLQ